MRPRREAREKAIQVIYSIYSDLDREKKTLEFNAELQEKMDQILKFERVSLNEMQIKFIKFLVKSTVENIEDIDDLIKKFAKNWDFHRISLIDKSILRLAIMEMRYSDTPSKVVINEAVELAASFSGIKSSRFINGILDAIMHKEVNNG